MRLTLRSYGLLTTALTLGIVFHAYSKYQQFYPAGVYLATAKHSLLIFANMLVVLAYFLGKLVVYMYLDRVQEREAEFATETCKAILYLIFFGVTLYYYGLPIHIIRQIFISLRTSIRRFADIRKYRNITNERFPEATEEELNNTDKICIVCREDMTSGKKLPCGHILHLSCLRSWLERQQSCPICRADVLVDDNPAAAAVAAPEAVPVAQPAAQPAVQPGAQDKYKDNNNKDLQFKLHKHHVQQQQQQPPIGVAAVPQTPPSVAGNASPPPPAQAPAGAAYSTSAHLFYIQQHLQYLSWQSNSNNNNNLFQQQ
eukprot:gene11508-13426_t